MSLFLTSLFGWKSGVKHLPQTIGCPGSRLLRALSGVSFDLIVTSVEDVGKTFQG